MPVWVSNTATALMMFPIALSVVRLFPDHEQRSREVRDFGTALLLAVAATRARDRRSRTAR